MKKTLFCLLALAAVATTARAQEAPAKNIFGVRGGLSISKMVAITDDANAISEARTSFHLGITDEIRWSKNLPLYFETGLVLQNKGMSEDGEKFKLMYLEVPALINYHFNVGKDLSIIPFAGLYYGFGISGKASSEDYGNVQVKVFGEDRLFKRSDLGGRFGVGATFRKHCYLGVGYESSFMDFSQSNQDDGVKFHNRTWTITLGYNF